MGKVSMTDKNVNLVLFGEAAPKKIYTMTVKLHTFSWSLLTVNNVLCLETICNIFWIRWLTGLIILVMYCSSVLFTTSKLFFLQQKALAQLYK